MSHTRVAAVDGYLAELEDDGRSRGEDVLAKNAHGKHGAVADVEVEELGNPRRVQARDRNAMHFGHFLWIRDERDISSGPYDDGCDTKPRTCRVVVQEAKHGASITPKSDFFFELTKRSVDGVLTFVDAAAWQRPLTAVMPEAGHPASDYERGLAPLVRYDRHRDCGVPKARVVFHGARVRGEIGGDGRPQCIVSAKHLAG